MHFSPSISAFGLLSLVVFSACQQPQPTPGPVVSLPPSLVQYTKENSGLPSNSVSRVVVDRRGIVWAGTFRGHLTTDTSRGVARFDGATWTVFNTRNSLLPGDGITDLALAPDDALWIATTGGLARFDRTAWQVFTKANAPFPGNFVRAVDVGTDGRVWIVFSQPYPQPARLLSYDGTRWTPRDVPPVGATRSYFEVRDLLVDANQTVWLAQTNGLLRLSGESWTVFRKDTLGMPLTKVGRLHKDRAGILWMTPYNGLFDSSGERTGAVVRFDGQRFESFLFPLDSRSAQLEYVPYFPLSITTDAIGRPWVGEIAALYRYDQQWRSFIPRDAKNIGFPIYDLTFEAQKRLWAATNNGLLHFIPE